MTDTQHESSEATAWLREELDLRESQGLRRRRRTITARPNGECEIDGRRLLNFASNDYLGLAQHPRLREAARQAVDEYGVGAGASALVTGRTEWHERLEDRISQFEDTESTLLFPTGYAANVGTIAALIGRGDVVFSDSLNHASLIDGCRLSRATVCVFPHQDVRAVEVDLKKHRSARRRLIVTNGVFSMDGNVAPLSQLHDLAEHYDALLLVDEAHSTGVLGESGRGACELLGVESHRVVRVGTLSKGIGALGGFVTGAQVLADYLWNAARTQVFSTSMPPAICAAACAAIDVIEQEPGRRELVLQRTQQLRAPLERAELLSPTAQLTPIVPVILGDAERTVSVAAQLEAEGILVAAIRPPTVPVGTSRLRISLSSAHTESAVEDLAQSLLKCVH
ncbi:MAG: 8-amino-7-oxononanoate synthase [Planctomycetaceae bacterium]